MENLQESWNSLRHSKWSVIAPYAVMGVGAAVVIAQFQLMADFMFEQFSVDWSERERVSDSEWWWRNMRLAIAGMALNVAAAITLLVVRPQWKPPSSTVHAIPVGFIFCVLAGVFGAQLFSPASWTDQVMDGFADLPLQIWIVIGCLSAGAIAGPYLIVWFWRREERSKLARPNWQMWIAVVGFGLVAALFATSQMFEADFAIERDVYVFGTETERPDNSGLRDANTLRMWAVGLQMVMVALAMTTKDRKPIHMYALSVSVLLGYSIGTLAPLLIAPGHWTDQSFEGMVADWPLYLPLPVLLVFIAIFASTFGAKKAKEYQASKQKALAD